MLASENIVAAHHHNVCGFYAVINLFRLRGLKAPGFDKLAATFLAMVKTEGFSHARRPGYSIYRGISEADIVALLNAFSFPAVCAAAILPPGASPREVFTSFLSAGCHLIVSYDYRNPFTRLLTSHAVVATGNIVESPVRGMEVLDSGAGHEDGSVISLQPQYTDEEKEAMQQRANEHPHGARRVLPFYDVATNQKPLGLTPWFVIAYPKGGV